MERSKPMVKVTCSRCGGLGQVVHRTARHDARCFCCGGKGWFLRKAPTKRRTQEDYLAEMNARIAEHWPQ